jgi:hypothetical protein
VGTPVCEAGCVLPRRRHGDRGLFRARRQGWLGRRDDAGSAAAVQCANRTGINLFGLANFNRDQVYLNLINQSEWFTSRGDGWTLMPKEQLDRKWLGP